MRPVGNGLRRLLMVLALAAPTDDQDGFMECVDALRAEVPCSGFVLCETIADHCTHTKPDDWILSGEYAECMFERVSERAMADHPGSA